MSTSSRLPAGSTVLVTGTTGLLGSSVAQELLKQGYKVRGTTRDLTKAEDLVKKFSDAYGAGAFEPVVVKDFEKAESYKDVIKGVSGVAHIATDGSFSPDPNVVVTGTVNSVLAVLKAAQAEPSVKAVVLTSSRIAAFHAESGKSYKVTPYTYFEEGVQKAWKYPTDDPMQAVWAYAASKVQGEQEAYKFVKEQKPHYTFSTVLPDYILGAPVNPRKGVYTTATWLNALFAGDPSQALPFITVPTWYVHVSDVARLHVAALTEPDVVGERIWAAAGPWTVQEILDIHREAYPDSKAPQKLDTPEGAKVDIDNSRGVELLQRQGRQGFIGMKEAILDTAASHA